MAYDESLAERIREAIGDRPGVTELKMFGGLCFMIGGNMFCGVVKDELMARIGPDQLDAALGLPNTRPMTFTGRPMKSMVLIAPPSIDEQATLSQWVEQCYGFAVALPAKTAPSRKRPPRPRPS